MSEPFGKLTAREVREMLTEAGVNYSALDIRDGPSDVIISGPQEPRTVVLQVLLLDYGLSVAPYPGHDEWCRR